MINTKFEAYKISREIKRSGKLFCFKRGYKNKYGEPTDSLEEVGSLFGLYHETSSTIQIQTGDTTQYRTKKMPMILCLYESCKEIDIKPNDFIIIENQKYIVAGISNIQNWNIISDIMLEVIDDGICARL